MQPRFLVVDVLRKNRDQVERLVKSTFRSSRIRVASEGVEGFHAAREFNPDVAVIGGLSPPMSGLEWCRRLKSDPKTEDIMVLLIPDTVSAGSRNRILGLESGADGCVCRPFEKAELIAQMKALLRIRRHEKALIQSKRRVEEELRVRRRVEKELKKATATAEAEAQAKSDFLAHMSHEIRTPMNAVIGMTEMLLDTTMEKSQREMLDTIRSGGEMLLKVINDILDFSKAEAQNLDLESQPLNVAQCVEEVLNLFQKAAERKKLFLRAEFDPGVPRVIVGDLLRLRQILSNLIGNAIKFTDRGGVILRMGATAKPGRRCELRGAVHDTGIGIPADKMDRLFKPFSQVDASVSRRFGGTGLGLLISWKLVELMGGKLWVESKDGQSSTFHFTLNVSLPRVEPDEQKIKTVGRVLVVKAPDRSHRKTVSLLKKWGVDWAAAASVKKAAEMMGVAHAYSAVLFFAAAAGTATVAGLSALQAAAPQVPVLVVLKKADSRETERLRGLCAAVLKRPETGSELFDNLAAIAHTDRHAIFKIQSEDFPIEPANVRILVAEDNEINRRVIEMMLIRMGFHPDAVPDGEAAVHQARAVPYDIVLMDVQMPRMDGLEAARRIRAEHSSGPRPRVVALTAHAMKGDEKKYIAAGMDDYISKPLREADLRAALVRQMCGKPTRGA